MATNNSDSKPKRSVRNPETFRERALKSSLGTTKTKKNNFISSALKKIISPIIDLLKKIFKIPPFNLILWLLVLLGKIIFPKYLRDSFKELKLVTWPNWQESRKLTYAVMVFAVIFGVVIAIVDYGLDKLFKIILLK